MKKLSRRNFLIAWSILLSGLAATLLGSKFSSFSVEIIGFFIGWTGLFLVQDLARCPYCEKRLRHWINPLGDTGGFCPHCGQAVDFDREPPFRLPEPPEK